MKKKAVIAVYACFFLLFFIVVSATMYSVYDIRTSADSETHTYLTEIASLCAQIVEKQIQKDFDMLKIYSGNFQGVRINSPDDYRLFFKRIPYSGNFKRMGIVLPDGTAFTSDDVTLNVSHRDFFRGAMQGQTTISNVLTDMVDGEHIVIYSVPVSVESGQIDSVFYAVQSIDVYSKLIGINPLAGRGESFIIKNSGSFISIPHGYGQYFDSFFEENIFDILSSADISKDTYLSFITDVTNRMGGIISFKNNGIKMHMSYAPIPSQSWMLLTVFESDQIAKITNDMVMRNSMIGIMFVLSICTAFLVLFWRENTNQREIEHIAFIDRVTGFSNWEKFKRDAAKLILNHRMQYAVISFETHNFRLYNEIYGQEKANVFLHGIAECISSICKPNETFCRISADNFVVLISYEKSAQIESYISVFSDKMHEFEDASVSSCLFGVYLIADRALPINDCCNKASVAKMLARQNKNETIAYYDQETHRKILEENELETVMEEALANGEFVMYLQPKVDIQSTKVTGAEALVRWNHPDRGIISPCVFLPIFEKNGFVMQLDYEICRQACELIRTWIDAGKVVIPISVNFSRLHLHKKDFIEQVSKIVNSYNLPHKYIEIEITETIAESFENANFLKDVIVEFQKSGYLVSMDDFGSGYSSLNMLAKLPVNILKMDKRFFDQDLLNDENKSARSIISRVIEIAKDLNMTVVAEGIENQEQYDLLRLMNCDMIQGFYFSPPVPVELFEHFVLVCNHF